MIRVANIRLGGLALTALSVAAMLVGPPAQRVCQAAAGREPRIVITDIDRAAYEMSVALPNMDALFDADQRAKVAPKALVPMKKMLGLTAELASVAPEFRTVMARAAQEVTGTMAILGDAEAMTSLEKQALESNLNRDERAGAKAWLHAVAWSKAMKDPRAQEKILSDYTALGKANSDNEMLAQVATFFCDYPATPALGEQAEAMMKEVLTSPVARQIATKNQKRRTLRALEGKPLIVSGLLAEGKPFSTDAWKGKVVLVDFWATWCQPCMDGLPKLKQTYADYHGKGLEIVGVSSDRDVENFRRFLADNKDMPWPQLIDPVAAAAEDPHPLLKTYGIDTLPTMIIIDKKGNCRSIKAHENFEELIKKLVAE